MKYVFVIFIVGLTVAFSSCRKCKECREYDDEKALLATQKLCGDDLKNAEKDTAHFECE